MSIAANIIKTVPWRYEEDRTGRNPDNLVSGENHELSNRSVRAVGPTYGAFYEESMIVEDAATGIALQKGLDWEPIEFAAMPSLIAGKQVFTVIIVYNRAVTQVNLTYQCFGGQFSNSMEAVVRMIEALDLGSRPVHWPDIIGKPDRYPPAPHFHDVGDVYGFEYITQAVYSVRDAILLGDTASHDEILRYIDNWGAVLEELIADLRADLTAHINDDQNPHKTTKAQVGLGLVDNFATALAQDAISGNSNSLFMTPYLTKQAIARQALDPLNAHMADDQNPHKTTKAQVGLGSVDNFPTASVAEAIEGILNNRFMTPALTRSAVQAQVGDSLAKHLADINNPHKVTKAQVGLDKVENYPIATKGDAEGGISNVMYMTPLRTLESIKFNALTRTDNWTTPVITSNKIITTFVAQGGGFTFRDDPLQDTGLFSQGASKCHIQVDGNEAMVFERTETSTNRRIRIGQAPLAMVQGDLTNVGGVIIQSNSGSGDQNCAGITMSAAGYAIKLGVRGDGMVGFGGGNAAAWRWYSDASGNATATGDVVAYSDPRLKENFNVIEDPFAFLDGINGYTFNWRYGFNHTSVKAGRRDYGVNAFEVAAVAPEFVSDSIEINGEKYLTVAYDKFIPVLIEAVKQQRSDNAALLERMVEMEAKLEAALGVVNSINGVDRARALQSGIARTNRRVATTQWTAKD